MVSPRASAPSTHRGSPSALWRRRRRGLGHRRRRDPRAGSLPPSLGPSLPPLARDYHLDVHRYLAQDLLPRPDHGLPRPLRDLARELLRTLDHELIVDAVYEASVETFEPVTHVA